MRRLLPCVICWLLVFGAGLTTVYGQDFTNKGKDFWIGYGNHVKMYKTSGDLESMSLYITSDVNTSGTVSISNLGLSIPFTVTANQISTINIPRTARLKDEGLSKNGIHVTALNGVVVYAHIYANNVSGATLCLPTSTLGREYYSINYTQVSNEQPAYSFFFVVATEDNTIVEIVPAAGTEKGWAKGSLNTVHLNKGEIYQVLSTTDLTGSTIKSIASGGGGCKKIAVYSGSGKLTIAAGNCSSNSADNVIQQVYPTTTWGKKYIAIPSSGRPFNLYRVLKSTPAARVYVDGELIPPGAFIDDLYYDFSGTGTHMVESDEPIMLAQYFTTQKCDGNSGVNDPEMIFLSPVEQTITNVTLNSTPHYNIREHYINIAVRNTGTAISSMMLDGNPIGNFFNPLPQDPAYSYAQIKVGEGKHQLISDSGFNAIAYGFGSTESYGYSAGTNMQDLYQYISIRNTYATVNFPAGCDDAPFQLSVTFPYQPLTLRWQFNGLFSDTLITSPVYDSTWEVNGRTLYQYRLQKDYSVAAEGVYPINIIANNPMTDGCSGEQQVDYELQIFARSKAAFTIDFSGCQPDEAKFAEINDGNDRPVINRFWDFGDGFKAEGDKNPVHIYQAAGDYEAKLFVVTDIGCLSDTLTLPVRVNPAPVADFSLPPVSCETQEVRFTDLSAIPAGGSIGKREWDMGDGTLFSGSAATHIFSRAGTYTASLQVTSDQGCPGKVVTHPVTVHYTPRASFTLPEVCLDDAYAEFTNNSTIDDNSAGGLTWHWKFDDPLAGSGNPDQSDVQNGRHRYHQAAEYDVTLTVTSAAGCVADTTIPFTVNGAVPVAGFQINNTGPLCSNQPVSITDQSTVDFGNVTRVEVYWDYGNDPGLKTVDEEPAGGKTYSHSYPEFGGSASREVEIVYVAYSGISCMNQVTRTINLQPSPQLVFDRPEAVCAEIPAFTITDARETSGMAGTGFYSGDGILASGVFNPHAVAPGIKTLLYRYTGAAGCSAELSQTIRVFPTPEVRAGGGQLILQGDTVLLNVSARGDGLRYEWSPRLSIDDVAVPAPKVYPTDDIRYRVTVTSAAGCQAQDQVSITVLKPVQAPNAFSPNGDGINDTWQIPYLAAYPASQVFVYNREGQMVYQSAGYSKPWDGRVNGNPLPFGTYYWIIKPGNGRAPINGSVTLLR